MEHLLLLEADLALDPLTILLGVEEIVGQMKENWSSVSLS